MMFWRLVLLLVAALVATWAGAQPDQYGWRHDPKLQRLDPEVERALRHYCQIMRERNRQNPSGVPPVCRRYFPGMFFPQRP